MPSLDVPPVSPDPITSDLQSCVLPPCRYSSRTCCERTAVTLQSRPKSPSSGTRTGAPARATMALCCFNSNFRLLPRSNGAEPMQLATLATLSLATALTPHCLVTCGCFLRALLRAGTPRIHAGTAASGRFYSGERRPGGDIFLDLPSRMIKVCASFQKLSIHETCSMLNSSRNAHHRMVDQLLNPKR